MVRPSVGLASDQPRFLQLVSAKGVDYTDPWEGLRGGIQAEPASLPKQHIRTRPPKMLLPLALWGSQLAACGADKPCYLGQNQGAAATAAGPKTGLPL